MDSNYSLADISAATGGNDRNFGFGGELMCLLVLFFFFMQRNGWGNWGGNNCDGPVNGFATRDYVQQGFNNSAVITKLDGITQGICDSTYALNNAIQTGFSNNQLNLCNGFNQVQQGMNQLGYQMQQCCCDTQGAIKDVRYDMATQACDTRNLIQSTTRDVIENQNCNTRAILDFLTQDKISTLQQENQALRFAASQSEQNAFIAANQSAQTAELIRRLGRDCPSPAFIVPNPNCCYGNMGSCA